VRDSLTVTPVITKVDTLSLVEGCHSRARKVKADGHSRGGPCARCQALWGRTEHLQGTKKKSGELRLRHCALKPAPQVDLRPTNRKPWPRRAPDPPQPRPTAWVLPWGDEPHGRMAWPRSARWSGALIRHFLGPQREKKRPSTHVLPVRGQQVTTAAPEDDAPDHRMLIHSQSLFSEDRILAGDSSRMRIADLLEDPEQPDQQEQKPPSNVTSGYDMLVEVLSRQYGNARLQCDECDGWFIQKRKDSFTCGKARCRKARSRRLNKEAALTA
jgi:hypothetical protein